MKPTLPYGSWPSTISSAHVAAAGRQFTDLTVDRACDGGPRLYWLESRPGEAGRNTIMTQTETGSGSCLEAPTSVRSTVYEYGGGAFTVHSGFIWFVNAADQAVWVRDPEGRMAAVTDPQAEVRFGDLQYDARRGRVIAVAEDFSIGDREPVARIVYIGRDGRIQTIAEGHDFYASPRLSPKSDRLVWLAWNHPNMPWDTTELWQARIDEDGCIGEPEPLWQPEMTSLFGPVFDPSGRLHIVADADDWWNIHREADESRPGFEKLTHETGEFAVPQWVFGQSTYTFTSEGRLFALMTAEGSWNLGEVDCTTGNYQPLNLDLDYFEHLVAVGNGLAVIAANATRSKHIRCLDTEGSGEPLRTVERLPADAALSRPEPMSWFVDEDELVHGLFYPPTSDGWEAQDEERPPLILKCHGGPTGAADTALNARIQYWTSRGYAVLDVNYRGSTGYGRAYRRALIGKWGVADVADCVSGAQKLADDDRIDPERILISGSSAGGYTVLSVLAFTDIATAGTSYYGIGDLKSLVASTHKFESRYLETLIGSDEKTLIERSPLCHADQVSCPVLFLQGGQDRVVPPDQALGMADALRERGIPVASLVFESEGHGFRDANNVSEAIEAERAFYSRILGIEVDDLVDLEIDNMDE